MIARLWSARAASTEDVDAYQDHFAGEVLDQLGKIPGFEGAFLLRGEHGEFVTMTLFESMDAVREFAGDDPTVANVTGPARRMLREVDERARHFTVVLSPLI